jgi:hypothetical protein
LRFAETWLALRIVHRFTHRRQWRQYQFGHVRQPWAECAMLQRLTMCGLAAGVLIWRRSREAHRWLQEWWHRGLSGEYALQFRDQTALKA